MNQPPHPSIPRGHAQAAEESSALDVLFVDADLSSSESSDSDSDKVVHPGRNKRQKHEEARLAAQTLEKELKEATQGPVGASPGHGSQRAAAAAAARSAGLLSSAAPGMLVDGLGGERESKPAMSAAEIAAAVAAAGKRARIANWEASQNSRRSWIAKLARQATGFVVGAGWKGGTGATRTNGPAGGSGGSGLGGSGGRDGAGMASDRKRSSVQELVLALSGVAEEDKNNYGGEAFAEPFLGTFRDYVFKLVTHSFFNNGILVVILINTFLIALQTESYFSLRFSWYFSFIDSVLLGIYMVELVLKLYALRYAFFKSGWNNFDAFIVGTSVVEYGSLYVFQYSSSTFDPKIFRLLRVFRAFRALRALRVLRTISFLKNLQVIVNTLLRSIPAMGSIILLLVLVLYIFAIMGVFFLGKVYPERFGNLGMAIFSLFQLITLDDWFAFYDTVAARTPDGRAGWMLAYLTTFIVLETFIFINLFIAVIVNNMEVQQQMQHEARVLHGGARRRRKRKKKKKKKKKKRKKGKRRNTLDPEAANSAQAVDLDLDLDEDDWNFDGEMIDGSDGPIGLDAAMLEFENQFDQKLQPWEKRLMGDYLMLLAALDNGMEQYQSQQKTLDDLVDITAQHEYERNKDM